MRQYLLLILLLSFSIPESYATIYKWTNERGVITYSQHKPSDHTLKTERIHIKTSSISNAEAKRIFCAADNSASTTPPENTDNEEALTPVLTKADKEALMQRCLTARKNLTGFNKGGNVLYKDTNGDYVRLTEEEKTGRRNKIYQFLSESCQ